MDQPKKKRNRPNMEAGALSLKPGRYAKHSYCRAVIVSQAPASGPITEKKAVLQCSKCHRKVGRRGYEWVRDTTVPSLEYVASLGLKVVFKVPAEEDSEASQPELPEQVVEDILSTGIPSDIVGALTGVTTGRFPSTWDRVSKDRKHREAEQEKPFTGPYAKTYAPSWNRTSKAAAKGQAAARRVQLDCGKDVVVAGTPSLDEMVHVAREARSDYVERAQDVINRCQLDGAGAPDWALRAVGKTDYQKTDELHKALVAEKVTEGRRRLNNAIAVEGEKFAQMVKPRRTYYEEN